MLGMTEEQIKRMEAKRQEALQRKKDREQQLIQSQPETQTGGSSLFGNNFKTPWRTSSAIDVTVRRNNWHLSRKRGKWNYRRRTPKTGCLLTAKFELSSRERFLVKVSFDAQVIDIFKSIPSGSYDTKTKQWSFHVKDHDKVNHELLMSKKVAVKSIPFSVLDIIKNNQDDKLRNIDLSRIEPVLLESLMPFQKEGIQFGISKGGRCLLADDMGLGKTIQALGIAHYYKEEWPLLIVAPSSVRYVWAEAIQKWLPSVKLCEVSIVTSSKEAEQIDKAQIVITSYKLMAKCKEMFRKRNFLIFIIDESHYIKSSKAQRSTAALYLLKNAKRIIMLTGTPALSRPQELFVQLSALKPSVFSSMINFGLRYCAAHRTRYGWDFSGSSNMLELRVLLESHVMIRRLKSDVITQLPSKIRQVITLDPKLVQSRSKEMVSIMKALKDKNVKGMERRCALVRYFFYTAKAKVKAVKEYIAELLEKGKKFICFAHHEVMINEICNLITEKGLGYICINGRVDSLDRGRLCDKFQLDDKCIVAVLSITAAGTGITLTAANLVVFAELYWNPGILIQAEDRAHRIGQTDSVLVQYLVAEDTADVYLWRLIQKKYNVLSKVGFNRENSLKMEKEILQSKEDSEMVKYFEEISNLDFEEENVQPESMDMGEAIPKKLKVDY